VFIEPNLLLQELISQLWFDLIPNKKKEGSMGKSSQPRGVNVYLFANNILGN